MKEIALEQIREAVNGTWLNETYISDSTICSVVIDSRKIAKNDLYIPIVGEQFDGHDFIKQAFELGALVVLSHSPKKVPDTCPAIIVKDTKQALGKLAKYYRTLFSIPIIGITGSVGKTSTKEMLASILSKKYKVHKTAGNYNNDIGLPLTLLELNVSHEVAVIELGMNHFGEIDYLADILKPTIALITNIGVSHIEYLGSREGILKAKAELLPHVSCDGLVVINGDDYYLKTLNIERVNTVLNYGISKGVDCLLGGIYPLEQGGQSMHATTKKDIYDIKVDYPGEHVLQNALGGILIAEYLGLNKSEIIEGIIEYTPAKMRMNILTVKDQIRIIDDAYNASVESMESALKTLGKIKGPTERTVAVIGSMFEMGTYSKEGHILVGTYVAKYEPDILVVIGKEGKWIYEGAIEAGYNKYAHYFRTQNEFLEQIDTIIYKNDLVLLKASRGMVFENIRDILIRKYEK